MTDNYMEELIFKAISSAKVTNIERIRNYVDFYERIVLTDEEILKHIGTLQDKGFIVVKNNEFHVKEKNKTN